MDCRQGCSASSQVCWHFVSATFDRSVAHAKLSPLLLPVAKDMLACPRHPHLCIQLISCQACSHVSGSCRHVHHHCQPVGCRHSVRACGQEGGRLLQARPGLDPAMAAIVLCAIPHHAAPGPDTVCGCTTFHVNCCAYYNKFFVYAAATRVTKYCVPDDACPSCGA